MFPEDIDFLFDQVAIATPVRIINEPVKVGWNGDELLMEVHQRLQFVAATNTRPGKLDWDVAELLLERADGVPAPVGHPIKNAATSAASENVPGSL